MCSFPFFFSDELTGAIAMEDSLRCKITDTHKSITECKQQAKELGKMKFLIIRLDIFVLKLVLLLSLSVKIFII